jgi:hypothetical protein
VIKVWKVVRRYPNKSDRQSAVVSQNLKQIYFTEGNPVKVKHGMCFKDFRSACKFAKNESAVWGILLEIWEADVQYSRKPGSLCHYSYLDIREDAEEISDTMMNITIKDAAKGKLYDLYKRIKGISFAMMQPPDGTVYCTNIVLTKLVAAYSYWNNPYRLHEYVSGLDNKYLEGAK